MQIGNRTDCVSLQGSDGRNMTKKAPLATFTESWAWACHTMWIELLALRCTQADLASRRVSFTAPPLLTDVVYAPECNGRLKDDTVTRFLDAFPQYQAQVVSSRLVLLSASFESFFDDFVELYLAGRQKYVNAGEHTKAGKTILEKTGKARGLEAKVRTFSDSTGCKIKDIERHLPALGDVYALRCIIAHAAGVVDEGSASGLQTVQLEPGANVTVAPSTLVALAGSVFAIAKHLAAKVQ